MKIYTKTGDDGTTSLANGQRVSKTDTRLQAYGTADELNSFVGLLHSKLTAEEHDQLSEQILWIQNKLFNLGAQLSGADGQWIGQDDVICLEKWIDDIELTLQPIHAFILPGGSEGVALAHVCRTITRRLEREMLHCSTCANVQDQDAILGHFINRLSDYWFVLAKKMAQVEKISVFLWKK